MIKTFNINQWQLTQKDYESVYKHYQQYPELICFK